MARPERNNAEYFTHDSDFRNDRRVKAIRSRFGAAGYGILLMLIETLTDAEFTQLSTDDIEIELLSGDFGVSATEIHSLLQLAEKIGFFSRNDTGMLICPDLNKWLEPVFDKRNRARNYALNNKKVVSVTETPESVTETPQSKEEKSKVKESKEEKSKEIKEESEAIAADAAPSSIDFVDFEIDPETEAEMRASLALEEKPSEAPHTEGGAGPTKEPALHDQMMEVYHIFYKDRNGIAPKIDGADGKALKTIAAHLKSVSHTKDEKGALNGFKWLFEHWQKLDAFHQGQLKITQINSNLNNIIAQIKNGSAKQQTRPNAKLSPTGYEPTRGKSAGKL